MDYSYKQISHKIYQICSSIFNGIFWYRQLNNYGGKINVATSFIFSGIFTEIRDVINKTIALYLFARWPQQTRQLSYFYYLFSPVDSCSIFYFSWTLQIFVYSESLKHGNIWIQCVNFYSAHSGCWSFKYVSQMKYCGWFSWHAAP